MKKWAALLSLVLILSLFSGCHISIEPDVQDASAAPEPSSEEKELRRLTGAEYEQVNTALEGCYSFELDGRIVEYTFEDGTVVSRIMLDNVDRIFKASGTYYLTESTVEAEFDLLGEQGNGHKSFPWEWNEDHELLLTYLGD